MQLSRAYYQRTLAGDMLSDLRWNPISLGKLGMQSSYVTAMEAATPRLIVNFPELRATIPSHSGARGGLMGGTSRSLGAGG